MVNSYLVGFCYIALWILFVIACVMGVTNLRIKFSNLLIAVLYIAILPVACNVIDRHQLGSIEYAVSHLKSPLVVVLGHTHCGAVAATIAGEGDSHIQSITDKIHKAIGDETDAFTAASLNVKYAVAEILDAFRHDGLEEEQVVGAVYDIETGEVYWN